MKLTYFLIFPATLVSAGLFSTIFGCGTVCTAVAVGCHTVGHTVVSIPSGGLLAPGTAVGCHAATTACLAKCGAATALIPI